MKFIRTHPVVDVDSEGSEQEGFRGVAERGRHEFFDGDRAELFGEIFLSFGSPGGLSGEHFVVDDSKGPYITFEAIFVLIESFRRHINWRSNII